MCQDCGVSNLDIDEADEETTNTWENGKYSTYDPEETQWLEQRLNEVADEVRTVRETTSDDNQHILETVNSLDENVLTLAKDIDTLKEEVYGELQVHIDYIKKSEEDSGSTFVLVKTEMEGAFQQQHATINKQNEEVQKAKTATDQMMRIQNKNQDKVNEMSHDLEELLTWKKEMTKQLVEDNDKYIKIETNEEEDDEITKNNECIEMETEYEIDDVDDVDEVLDQETDTTIAIQNEILRINWYKFSARFMPMRNQEIDKKYLNGLRNVKKWD